VRPLPQSRFKKILIHAFSLVKNPSAPSPGNKSECPLRRHKNAIGKSGQKHEYVGKEWAMGVHAGAILVRESDVVRADRDQTTVSNSYLMVELDQEYGSRAVTQDDFYGHPFRSTRPAQLTTSPFS
jgi:hypothetical protein